MSDNLVNTSSPGRPKDMAKRQAILEAAKILFLSNGYANTSMDAVALEAGVSKLTVYSHFTDKESLFGEAVREKCAEQMPVELFDVEVTGPLREQLTAIANAFFCLVTSEESIALHRLLTTGAGSSAKLAQIFWEAGPQSVQREFAQFLRREVEARQLEIADIPRAAQQFFCLLKGDLHARQLCGCSGAPFQQAEIDQHIAATVEMFLRAYAPGMRPTLSP
jgi:TetR/AcrR family transcriptional regulator, mexJK operon transcriptional repressor